MKTNYMFRLLLMVIAMVVGGNHVNATVFYDNNGGTDYVEFPFGSFENEEAGSVLRVTYVVEPQNGWTPDYKITFGTRQSVIFEQSVTADGTIDIPLMGFNSTNQYNISAYLSGAWVKFKKVESVKTGAPTTKTDVTLSFSSSSVTIGMRQSLTPPTLRARANGRNISGLSYIYSSSNTDVAEVNNNGNVTLKAVGATVITATFTGNDNYNSASASYTLTVAPTFTLTFILDNEVFDVQYLMAGEVINAKTPSYKSGYVFGGWTGLLRYMPANDLTLYGYYTKSIQNVTLSVGKSGYSTYCTMQPLRFMGTEGVKAYIAKAKDASTVKLSQIVGTVAVGTGLVLKGWAANASDQFEVVESGTPYNDNLLVGVMYDTEIKSFDQYVLVQKVDGVKFADTGYNAAVVPAGKAYLQAPSSGSRILSITFEDDETTGITILPSMAGGQSSSYYNLGGQRVANPTKGLYIVNGKKTVFK